MGKKRRYIHKVKKFGRKMFDFLDKLDGNAANDVLEDARIDNVIDRVTVVDRGNRTIFINSRALGADFSAEEMHYQVNELTEDEDIACDATGTGPDKFTFPSAIPAVDGVDGLILLAAGQHTVTAELKGGTENAPLISDNFHVAEAKLDLSKVVVAPGEGGDAGKIKISTSEDIDVAAAPAAGAAGEAAGRLPGEEAFTLGSAVDKNDLDITIVTGSTEMTPVAATGYSVAGNVATSTGATADIQTGFHIEKDDGTGSAEAFPPGTYTVTITPNLKNGTAHTPSAITKTVTIA